GLPRIPGLNRPALARRLATQLATEDLESVLAQVVAGRFGFLSVSELVDMLIGQDATRLKKAGSARLDLISESDVRVTQPGPPHWAFVVRRYDVGIDTERRELHCSCPHFRVVAGKAALCKHLAQAFKSMPAVYAHTALIDLLLRREYSGPQTDGWDFRPQG
ncbi:MAG: hypothetical protein GYB68_08690, partial [Chloroflexi bacterium]|nr:hypothetical protein [Chloroflexota bacterium]